MQTCMHVYIYVLLHICTYHIHTNLDTYRHTGMQAYRLADTRTYSPTYRHTNIETYRRTRTLTQTPYVLTCIHTDAPRACSRALGSALQPPDNLEARGLQASPKILCFRILGCGVESSGFGLHSLKVCNAPWCTKDLRRKVCRESLG